MKKLQILEEIGIDVGEKEAREIFLDHGFKVKARTDLSSGRISGKGSETSKGRSKRNMFYTPGQGSCANGKKVKFTLIMRSCSHHHDLRTWKQRLALFRIVLIW
jgi:hypothetical protein